MKYALMLNDMRSSNVENLEVVKVANNRDELVQYYKSMLAEKSYDDGKWRKIFKKDSELEWYNPSDNLEQDNYFWGGIYVFPGDYSDESIKGFQLYKA